MGEYFFGLLMGVFIGALVLGSVNIYEKEGAAKSGWITIGGEVYMLRKADVVDAAKEVKP